MGEIQLWEITKDLLKQWEIEYQASIRRRWQRSQEVKQVLTVPAVAPTGNWRSLAACRGMDTNLFFPEHGEPSAEVVATCSSCPVNVECADYAIDNPEVMGVWALTSGRRRAEMRIARRLAVSA